MNTTIGAKCEQGSVPVVGVDARSVQDVQAAVNFAREANLRLVVKNSGHDYLGRSAARGSFMIWTHFNKDITRSEEFRPQGAAPSSETYHAVTLGAGVEWHEAYTAVHQYSDRVIVGGVSAGGSVGAAGGWLLGGGHSPLSPKYGLGVDNVLEINLVTSAGEYLTANAHLHRDLFWALRGGGGGTFGVVTSVSYQTHPITPAVGVFLALNLSEPTTMKAFVAEFFRLAPSFADAGLGGYVFSVGGSFTFYGVMTNMTQADVDGTIQPLRDFAATLTSQDIGYTISYDSFETWRTQCFGSETQVPGQVGLSSVLASRLIPRKAAEERYTALANVFVENGGTFHLVAGGAVSKIAPDAMGLNPAWRSSIGQIIHSAKWIEGTAASVIQESREKLTTKNRRWDEFNSEPAAYFNEASLHEDDPERLFFGANRDRLREVKKMYDPVDLFVVPGGVGSKEWDSELKCMRS